MHTNISLETAAACRYIAETVNGNLAERLATAMSEQRIGMRYLKNWSIQTDQHPVRHDNYDCGCFLVTRGDKSIDQGVCEQHQSERDAFGRVTCLDCGWRGRSLELKAQACPVCDGRCADC